MLKKGMQGASWDSIFLIIVRFVTTLTTIIQTKVLSVGLSLHEYGSYSQAILVTGVTASLIMFGLGDGLNYFYNRETKENAERSVFVNTIFLMEVVLGGIGIAAICLSRNLLAGYFNNPDVSVLLCIVAIKPVLDNVIYLYQLLFISRKKAKVIAIRNLVISIVKAAAIWFFVQYYASVKLICVSLVVLDVLNWIIFKVFLSSEGVKIDIGKANLKYVKSIVIYSFPMGVYAFTNALLRDIDKLVIGNLADTTELAIYTNCSKILPFDLVATSFATVLIPYIMKCASCDDKSSMETLFANYLRIGYYSVWTLAFSVLLVSGQVIEFLYSPAYVVGNDIFILYLFDSMIRFAGFHLVLIAKGRSKDIMIYSLISLMANFVLNILLYFIFGLIGPAMATVIVTAVYTVLILRKTIAVTGMRLTHVVDPKELFCFLGELIGFGLVFAFINRVLLNLGISGFLSMVLVMAGFCGTIFIINIKKLFGVLKAVNSLKLE